MATKTKVKKESKQEAQVDNQEEKTEGQDGPVLDLSDAAVKKMIKAAKKRGYVTTEELNRLLSSISDQVSGLPEEDRGLQALFKDVKRHTIVGYYTSLEGRTEELDLPARIQRVQWQGCSDAAHQRSAG